MRAGSSRRVAPALACFECRLVRPAAAQCETASDRPADRGPGGRGRAIHAPPAGRAGGLRIDGALRRVRRLRSRPSITASSSGSASAPRTTDSPGLARAPLPRCCALAVARAAPAVGEPGTGPGAASCSPLLKHHPSLRGRFGPLGSALACLCPADLLVVLCPGGTPAALAAVAAVVNLVAVATSRNNASAARLARVLARGGAALAAELGRLQRPTEARESGLLRLGGSAGR